MTKTNANPIKQVLGGQAKGQEEEKGIVEFKQEGEPLHPVKLKRATEKEIGCRTRN